ncbi:hypothetical protein TYRP_009023 [Tyrophagus putrescentiae]|nr:hypothetical protein TYRP_009023 [Tyrophagus putrescentiae]
MKVTPTFCKVHQHGNTRKEDEDEHGQGNDHLPQLVRLLEEVAGKASRAVETFSQKRALIMITMLGNSLPEANRLNQVSPCILDRFSGQLSPGHGRPEGGGRRLLAVELRVDETDRNHRRHLLFSFLSKVQKVPLKLRKTPQRQHLAEDEVPLGAGRRLPPSLVGGQVEAVLVAVVNEVDAEKCCSGAQSPYTTACPSSAQRKSPEAFR